MLKLDIDHLLLLFHDIQLYILLTYAVPKIYKKANDSIISSLAFYKISY